MTCGLRNSENPTSDNLKPQETTIEDASDVGLDADGLPCPGSSVVAEEDGRVYCTEVEYSEECST